MQRSTSSRSHAPLILAATIAALLSAPACVTDNVELDDVDQGSGIRDLQDQGSFGSDMRGDLSSGEPDEMGATDMFGQDMGSTSDMNQRDMFVADMPAACRVLAARSGPRQAAPGAPAAIRFGP